MGKLTYDSTLVVDFDDRTLAHLQVVIGAKLRRGESFQFTWHTDPADGSGRNMIWFNPGVPVGFQYSSPHTPRLIGAWIEALMETAHTAVGLRIVPEPTQG